MKNKKMKSITAAVCAGIFSLGLVSTAQATLEVRLGGLAVYDTDLNITWLANANAGAGSSFDDGLNNSDGLMTWASANAWAASLTVGGVSGWRLPTTLQPDPTCSDQSGGDSTVFGCTGSEMGHLFYTELGGVAPFSILSSVDPDLALFTNIKPEMYWSGTEYARNKLDRAWVFTFFGGVQFENAKFVDLYAWAVHDGDISASLVPEPGTLALMGLGLMGLLGFGQLQRRR